MRNLPGKTSESAVARGIKTAGVGKRGSKPLDAQTVSDILGELNSGAVPDPAIGALFAGLCLKGITEEEARLDSYFSTPGTLSDPVRLAQALCPDTPQDIRETCTRLLEQKELSRAAARRLGDFLMSDLPGDRARGLAASALRVRYETQEEYKGLLESVSATMAPGLCAPIPAGDPVIQMAEPFDGVDRSFLITPVVARFLQTRGYRSVILCGRNPGPKNAHNVFDLGRGLNMPLLKTPEDLARNPKPPYGWLIDQKDLSPAMDRWVDIRRQIVKRPFLATLERFLNPLKARIMISSAFHPSYGDKMAEVAETAGADGAIIVRNGMEGTTAFALKRAAKLICSARQAGGLFRRHEFDFDPAAYLGQDVPADERLDKPPLEENIRLVRQTAETGKSGNRLFDLRVRATCAGLRQALDWIETNIGKS